jgi:hypothetical protein
MVLSSAFNNDLKALVWITTLLPFLLGLAYAQRDCLFKPNAMSPMVSAFFIMYTLGYLVCPMAMYKDWNFIAIGAFLLLFAGDVAMSKDSECYDNRISSFKGGVIGFILGAAMFVFAKAIGLSKHLYYTAANSSMYCSKPKEQNFKCYVYKNGSIISAL